MLPCTRSPSPELQSLQPHQRTSDLPFVTSDSQRRREGLAECVHELVPLSLRHDLEFLIVVLEELVLLDDLGIATFPALAEQRGLSGSTIPANPAHQQVARPKPTGRPSLPVPTAWSRFLPPSVSSSAPSVCGCSRRPLARRPMAHAAAHAERTPRPSTARSHAVLPADSRGPQRRGPSWGSQDMCRVRNDTIVPETHARKT